MRYLPNTMAAMKVAFFHRRPQPGHFSLERLFEDVRRAMPTEIKCSLHIARFASRGIWRRLYNILAAPFYQKDVNHITGDVHYLTFLLPKSRTLLTIHDCASLERLRGFRRAALRLLWYTLPMSRAGLISVVSEATKAELLRHVRCKPDKIRVVMNCVSASFCCNPRPFNVVKPTLLHIGTSDNKNLFRVAQALAGISCRLEIIGCISAEQKEALQRNAVDFVASAGLCDQDMVAVYRACDMVIFASTYEGLGLPIVEANATGRPVITSDLLSMPEVAADAACLVNPFDVASIRAGIRRVIEDADYRAQLIDNGYINVRRFSADAIAQRYAELYSELLDR